MADVFLSYARANLGAAKHVAANLRSAGFSVWFDENLPAHRAYSEVIEEQLDSADCVVVLWSKEAVSSQWVRSEANRARETGRLVQARLDGARLPMPFDQIQCADLRSWSGKKRTSAWQAIEESVGALAAGERPAATARTSAAVGVGRRAVMIGGAAALAGIGALGGVAWYRPRTPEVPPKAQQLVQKAFAIMQDGRPEEQDQATAYLLEATEIAPDFARAWGALAITYSQRKYQVPSIERAGNEERCRSAARKALELDPDEPFAESALVLLIPVYRNWEKIERLGRRLTKRHPDIPMTQHILADSMTDTGRWREAVKIYEEIDRVRFVIPLSDRSIIQGLWGAGELQRAEALLDGAAERWPRHRAIWNLRAEFLMHTGRAKEALRLLENESTRPPDYPDDLLEGTLAMARALGGAVTPAAALKANLDMLATVSPDYLTYLSHKIATAQIVAQRAVALGDNRTALELLEGYYFGRGRWAEVAPPGGDDDRNTVCLFEPPMRGVWRDPGFGDLIGRIGLGDYWRRSGTRPDYRT